MALTQVTGPYPIFTDLDGTPLDDGYLYIGDVNDDPETNPIQVYWDSALTIAATQPIRTSNGYAYRNGTPALIYTAGGFSITIRNKREEFVLYSPVGYGFDPAAVSASVVKNDFIGDGIEVDFTLSAAPSTKLATNVFINGVYQEKDSYSILGNVLTFSIAPPLNSSIEVMTNETGVINSGNATAISYTASFAGATAQTVQTKLEQYISVKDFGAVGDNVTDDTAAIQDALDYAGSLNGAEVFFPSGDYATTASLTVPSNVTLRGQTSLQGGAASIRASGATIFTTPAGGGFHFFNLYNLAIWGDRVDTDFIDQSGGGSWAFSTIANCYIVNVRNFHTLTTGNHFLNNNFQNIVSMELRGGDYTVSDNYIGFDDSDLTKTSSDALVGILSSTGVEFSRNYLTSMRASNAPIPLNVQISVDVRILSNWIDGGKDYGLTITGGSYGISANFNRFGVIYPATCIPILLSNVTDVNVNENQFNSLAASAPFITFTSTLERCNVLNNLTNSRTDATTHDYGTASAASGVRMVGNNLAVKDTTTNLDIYPPLFGRTIINQSTTGTAFFYVTTAMFLAGDYFNFSRTNTSQRLIIRNTTTSTNIYDSNTSGFNTGRVICYVAGTLTVEQTV